MSNSEIITNSQDQINQKMYANIKIAEEKLPKDEESDI